MAQIETTKIVQQEQEHEHAKGEWRLLASLRRSTGDTDFGWASDPTRWYTLLSTFEFEWRMCKTSTWLASLTIFCDDVLQVSFTASGTLCISCPVVFQESLLNVSTMVEWTIASVSWSARLHHQHERSFTVDMGTEKGLGLIPQISIEFLVQSSMWAHPNIVSEGWWRQFLHDGSDGQRHC